MSTWCVSSVEDATTTGIEGDEYELDKRRLPVNSVVVTAVGVTPEERTVIPFGFPAVGVPEFTTLGHPRFGRSRQLRESAAGVRAD